MKKKLLKENGLILWFLMPLSTLLQLYIVIYLITSLATPECVINTN